MGALVQDIPEEIRAGRIGIDTSLNSIHRFVLSFFKFYICIFSFIQFTTKTNSLDSSTCLMDIAYPKGFHASTATIQTILQNKMKMDLSMAQNLLFQMKFWMNFTKKCTIWGQIYQQHNELIFNLSVCTAALYQTVSMRQ